MDVTFPGATPSWSDFCDRNVWSWPLIYSFVPWKVPTSITFTSVPSVGTL